MYRLLSSSPHMIATFSIIDFLSIVPYIVIAAVIVFAWWIAILQLDVFTPPDIRAWRSLSGMRGYAGPVGTLERLATRSALLGRIQKGLDLARLLPIANYNVTPLGFISQTAVVGLIACAVYMALEMLGYFTGGGWYFPPAYVILVFIFVYVFAILRLQRTARSRQETANKTISDMLMMVAIMTDGRGLQVEDAVKILSRCTEDGTLQTIVDDRGWTKLIKTPHKSTAELYRMIGDAYEIPMFTMLSDALLNTNVGLAERNTFTNLARISYERRLTEAKMNAARAKILVTIPVAGMLLPLLVLIGFPAFQSIAAGIGGH
ncbi:MAG: hypothetical protein ACP5OR_06505 [Candidatus Dormibacteria bacterium]